MYNTYIELYVGGIMKNLEYKEIKKIEAKITKQLFKFINKSIDIENILEKVDFIYPYLNNESSRLAFNLWLSMDYIDYKGKTFIQRFLEENSFSLTKLEKQILKEKSSSRMSIFKIIKYQDDYIYIRDMLDKEEYQVWESSLVNNLYKDEYLLARIGKISGLYNFIGEVNYLPISKKSIFVNKILKDFNKIRIEYPLLTMTEYFKKYSLNIYKLYSEFILEDMNIVEDIHLILFSELEDFESYLISKDKSSSIQKHLSNLINIFEYYLSDYNISLEDLNQINIEDFFTNAMKDKFINSQDELNSYISTLKLYLFFLSNKDKSYRQSYLEILDISENRFYYMNKLNFNKVFNIDLNLVNKIDSKLNNDGLNILMDFENFILFIGEDPLEVTSKNKYIKRKYLEDINNRLIFKTEVDSLAPNQNHFPLIHLFYHAALELEISEIKKGFLVLNDKAINFLKLSDEEKYYLLFHYLWDENFLADLLLLDKLDYWKNSKYKLITMLSKLVPNNKYNLESLPSNKKDLLNLYYDYLKDFGLIRFNTYQENTISISDLGHTIFKYLSIKKEEKDSIIISLDKY